MNISKYITKKNVVTGAVVGTTIIGGIVAIIINHNKKKRIAEIEDFLDISEFILTYMCISAILN